MIALDKYTSPRSVLAMTGGTFLVGIVLTLWLSSGETGVGSAVGVITQAQKWESLEIQPNGLVVRNVYNLFPIATLLALTFLSFVGVAFGALKIWSTLENSPLSNRAPASDRVIAAGFKIENELVSILDVIGSHITSNQNFSQSLAEAQTSLGSMPKPEQVRTVVKFLVSENEKMERESSDLKGKLEQSHSQIESLRSNLSEAEAIGMRDPLTSVGNRRCFDATLSKEISDSLEMNLPLSLVMGDIDNFKKVNDTHGHLVGDDILKVFARLLSENVKGKDTVARFGGEEFALILPETKLESAASLAERIRGNFEGKNLANSKTGEKLGTLTASFGVSQLRDGDSPELLIQRADAKLYEAKCDGRNRVAVYGHLAD
jgi:diguanylate cyclase